MKGLKVKTILGLAEKNAMLPLTVEWMRSETTQFQSGSDAIFMVMNEVRMLRD